MTKKSFQLSITIDCPAQEAMKKISHVNKWWATNVSGNTKDIFTVRFGKTFATMKVVELVPNEKLVWNIIDCDMPLFRNSQEWLNTKLLWQINQENNHACLTFTHDGLTPELSCYEDCKKGWTYYVCESLRRLIGEGNGMPGTGIFSYIVIGERKYEGLLYFKDDPIPLYEEGFIYVDVLKTRGEEITSIQSVEDYSFKDFKPEKLFGEYYMIIENKPLSHNILPLNDIATMVKKDFHCVITVKASADEATRKINQVNKWWAKKVKGTSQKLHDKFTVHFGETFVDFQITGLVPGKEVVWLVTDCNLHWIDNREEWKGTKVVFKISSEKTRTKIDFTHLGLIPVCECYEDCEVGWTEHITDSLVKFISGGKGNPQ